MNEASYFLAGKSSIYKILANRTSFFIIMAHRVANMAAIKARKARETKTLKHLVVLATFIVQVMPNDAHMSHTTNAGRQ